MVNPKRFYTYAYLREDRTPYYIGKGQGKRAYYKYRKGLKPPKDKSRIIFLKQNLTEEEAFKHEIYMISIFGRKDLRTGILYNETNGGDGCSGRIVSEEERIKHRDFGKKCYEMKIGTHKRTKDQMTKHGKKIAESHKKNKTGFFSENHVETCRKAGKLGGRKAYELGVGIHGRTKEKMSEDNRKGGEIMGRKTYELGIGIHALTPEQRKDIGRKGGKISGSQKWICLETGYVSNPGGLTCYQRARGIDTSKRKRID